MEDAPHTSVSMNGTAEIVVSDHSDDDIFTQRLNTEVAKTEKQARLVKRKNKISFSTSKRIKNTVAKTQSDAEQIGLIMDNILIIDLMEETRQKKKNLLDFTIFWEFMCLLMADSNTNENLMPIPVIIILQFLMIQTPLWEKVESFSRQTILSSLFDSDAVQLTDEETEIVHNFKAKNFKILQRFRTTNPTCPRTNHTLGQSMDHMMEVIQTLDMTPFEYAPLVYITRIWEALDDTYRTYVSRAHPRILHTFYTKYEPSCLGKSLSSNPRESSLFTATTSTSPMCAPIQTRLVAAAGSMEVKSGGQQKEFDIDDVFTSLSSRFTTGKTSLDISLQVDTQNKTLKSEVLMDEIVYDLKIYKSVNMKFKHIIK